MESPFAHIPPDKEADFRFLLERVYRAIVGHINLMEAQIKGALGEGSKKFNNLETRLAKLENCPCMVHKDPANKCPVMEIKEALALIQRRLAWWGGGLAVMMFILELFFRLVPFLRG